MSTANTCALGGSGRTILQQQQQAIAIGVASIYGEMEMNERRLRNIPIQS